MSAGSARAFPIEAIVEAPPALAVDLRRAADRHPPLLPSDYHVADRQAAALAEVRAGCPEAYDGLVAQIRARLAEAPFSAVVRGLSFDESHRVFAALCRSFGELVSHPPGVYPKRAQLLHFIRPAEDLGAASGQALTERLHTDAADWPEPADLVAMICVRPDPAGGGRSRLLDLPSLRRAVEARLGAGAVALLESEAVPWRLPDYLGGGFELRPILAPESVRFRRYTLDFALREGARISPAMSALLDPLERLLEGAPETFERLLEEGELLFMDNRRCLHGRTPLGAPGVRSERLMIRSWIRAPGGRLPALPA